MAIIGISGKMGSGKDTVGRMIQRYYRCMQKDGFKENVSLDTFLKAEGNDPYNSGWEIKKFAGKLKQNVSLLTGIPLASLDIEEVKKSQLPAMWDRFYCPFCEQIVTEFTKDGGCRECFGNVKKQPMTVRDMLQQYGTEVGRAIHPDFWVNALFADYHDGKCPKCKEEENIHTNWDYSLPHMPVIDYLCNECGTYFIEDRWLIPDVRFINEVKAIESNGGLVIRVTRPGHTETGNHASEISLDRHDFEYNIVNDGSLGALCDKVSQELIKHFSK